MADFSPLLSGLAFPEDPRWHEGRLWFSDMHGHQVIALGLDGAREDIVAVPTQPSGLGWRPDGTLLIVSMTDRRLMALKEGALEEVADLSALATWHCNDMVVDAKGRAYIGNFGFDLYAKNIEPKPANLIFVDLDGSARVAAQDMMFPNGSVITPDGKTLIVGESFGRCLSAFDIAEDGMLSNRRVWAALEDCTPDGICLDEAGGIWLASPVSAECVRVEEGGRITHRLKVETQAFACMLGGPDGKTLFACTAEDSHPDVCKEKLSGRIEIAPAPYAHAGWP